MGRTTIDAPRQDSLAKSSLVESARRFAQASRAENTRRAYGGDLRRFATWCRSHDVEPLPATPETLALYIAYLAEEGRAPATIRRAISAIGQAHRLAGFPSPADDARVRDVERGVRREKGTRQRQAEPLLPEDLRAAFRDRPRTPRAVRDRALVLLGFAGALRREELTQLDFGDVELQGSGMVITVRSSKTDPEGRGFQLAIPAGSHRATCPLRAVADWLALLPSPQAGPLFRSMTGRVVTDERISSRAVARAVKRVAALAGLDPTLYSGHSLRAGLATAAARAGKPERAIMRQGRWRSRATVDRYVRDGRLWQDENAAEGIGL